MSHLKHRLTHELKLFQQNPHPLVEMVSEPNNIFTWYFLFKGPANTAYQGGYYLCKLVFNPNLLKLPKLTILTPNGSFVQQMFQEGYWNPLVNLRSAMDNMIQKIIVDDTPHEQHGQIPPFMLEQMAQFVQHGQQPLMIPPFMVEQIEEHEPPPMMGQFEEHEDPPIMMDQFEEQEQHPIVMEVVGHNDVTREQKQLYAKESIEYNQKNHKDILKLFSRFVDKNGNIITD